jgi:hypothetical protein
MVSYENLRIIHLRLQVYKTNEKLFGDINVLLLYDVNVNVLQQKDIGVLYKHSGVQQRLIYGTNLHSENSPLI